MLTHNDKRKKKLGETKEKGRINSGNGYSRCYVGIILLNHL